MQKIINTERCFSFARTVQCFVMFLFPLFLSAATVTFDASTLGGSGLLGVSSKTVNGTDGTAVTLRSSGPVAELSYLYATNLAGSVASGENVPCVGIDDEAVKGGLANVIINANRNEVLTISFDVNVAVSSMTFAGITQDDDEVVIHGFTTDPGTITYETLGTDTVSGITSTYDDHGRRLVVRLKNIELASGGEDVSALVLNFANPPSLDFLAFSADHSGSEPATSAGVGISSIEYTPTSPGPLTVSLDASTSRWGISPYLVGLHQAYGFTPDYVFEDGTLAAWARRVGIATSRFPGGNTVKYWHWQAPSGENFGGDPWDPSWDTNDTVDASLWMSLDEYLDFVEASGIAPHFGVNCYSGKKYDREADSIDRAVAMVEYVVARGHTGAWWYIGNEEELYHGKGTTLWSYGGYAEVVARHTTAMKAVDPDLKVLLNFNSIKSGKLQNILTVDSGQTDGLETHGKWPYGGKPDEFGRASFAQWQTEVPLRDWKNFRTWRTVVDDYYRPAASSAGRTNYFFANNEYGFGKKIDDFDRYKYGLAISEFLMEHFIGNWDMTAFWDLKRNNSNATGTLSIDGSTYRINPSGIGMNLLADAQGGEYVSTISTRASAVHGFAAKRNDALLVYLLNKSSNTHTVNVEIAGASYPAAFGRRLENSADGYGQITRVSVTGTGSNFTATLPPLTFSEFVFANPETSLEIMWIDHNVACETTFQWTSLPGALYDIEASPDLNVWDMLETNIAPDDLLTDSTFPLSSESRQYYRVRLNDVLYP